MKLDSPAFRIRSMTVADLDAMLALAASLPEMPRWSREVYLAALTSDAMPQRIAFGAVATGTDALAGFAVAGMIPPESELECIGIAPAFQRQGVATALWNALARELHRRQVIETLLEVRASNRRALSFYQKLGFSETARRLRYYADPPEDAILMRIRFEECSLMHTPHI